jgi:hypothetical protein|tara:strand:- start:1839 stop:2252 length:414 start_codon:yes stop_codon:yes gene_type:complete
MDLDKLFSLFYKNPEEDIKENLESYKSSHKFKLEMFSRLVLEGVNFRSMIISFFIDSDIEMDKDELSEVGDFMMYNRSWFWIQQFELDDPEWCEALNNCKVDSMFSALDLCISYFESNEEYEKCSFLASIKHLIEVP